MRVKESTLKQIIDNEDDNFCHDYKSTIGIDFELNTFCKTCVTKYENKPRLEFLPNRWVTCMYDFTLVVDENFGTECDAQGCLYLNG